MAEENVEKVWGYSRYVTDIFQIPVDKEVVGGGNLMDKWEDSVFGSSLDRLRDFDSLRVSQLSPSL